MAAQAVTSSRREPWQLSPALTRLVRAMLLAAVLVLLFVAGWLLVRRMGGQLQRPLGSFALVLVAVVFAALASLVRLLWYRTGLGPRRWRSWAAMLWLGPSCAFVWLALALSITGTSTVALVAFWGILLLTEGVWYAIAWRLIRSPEGQGAAGPTAPAESATDRADRAGIRAVELDQQLGECDEECDEQLPEDVCQQFTRSRAEEDADTVTGLLRARFEPNKRSQSLHVAFCPPMLRRPRVTVDQLRGPRTRIKVADAQPFGIRFDLRLVAADLEEQDVLIHFEANCAQPEVTGPGGLGI